MRFKHGPVFCTLATVITLHFASLASAQHAFGTGGYYGETNIPPQLQVSKAAGGLDDCAVIDVNGRVHIYGKNALDVGTRTSLQILSPAKEVALGAVFGAIVTTGGRLETFGTSYSNRLLEISPARVPSGSDFEKVTIGNLAASALRKNGTIASWGYDWYRQVSQTPKGEYRSVAQSFVGAYAVASDGTLTSWGNAYFGDRSLEPTDDGYVSVHASQFYENVLAIRADGTIRPLFAENGLAGQIPSQLTNPEHPQFSRVKDAALGAEHGIARLENGTVVAWGNRDAISDIETRTAGSFIGQIAATNSGVVCVTGAPPSTSISLSLNRFNLEPGESTTARITLSEPLNQSVEFKVSAPKGITVARKIAIPAGARWIDLPLQVDRKASEGTKLLSVASLDYYAAARIVVVPSTQRIHGLTLRYPVLPAGEFEGIVFLNQWSREGIEVEVTSDNPDIVLPKRIWIQPRSNRATFRIQVKDVAVPSAGTITVRYGSSSASRPVYIKPNPLIGFNLSSGSATLAQTVSGTVTLTYPAAEDIKVELKCNRPNVAPPFVVVPKGSRSGSFELTLNPSLRNKGVKIIASRNGDRKVQTVFINP